MVLITFYPPTSGEIIVQFENVNRAYNSASKVKDLRRPDCQTPMKVLVDKTFRFVESLWTTYIAQNKVDASSVNKP